MGEIMEKLKHTLHYVIDSVNDSSNLGATKLNKILWFSDLYNYMKSGEPITGVKYVKRQHGPVPEFSVLCKCLEELEYEELIKVSESEFYGRVKRDFVSRKSPEKEKLENINTELLDSVIEDICTNHTANSISELSHDEIWEMADNGEEIPLYTVFSHTPGYITDEDIRWAGSAT